MDADRRETALIAGVGHGLGAALARTFARAGMDVVVASRNETKLEPLVEEIARIGVSAGAYACDVAKPEDVEALFAQTEADFATPDLVVFNAGAYSRSGILDTTAEEFVRCWGIACFGGFLVGQAAAKRMVARGYGTILFTGATASLRGGANFLNLTVPKFGLRALAQSMARELQPKGVHVAHIIIDGQIMNPDRTRMAAERPPDGLLDPDAVASAYLMLHRQHRSAWTQELDMRPWVEKF